MFEFVWVYSRHGLAGFQVFMQEAVYTHIPITLASVAMAWLLTGFLLWLNLQRGSQRIMFLLGRVFSSLHFFT